MRITRYASRLRLWRWGVRAPNAGRYGSTTCGQAGAARTSTPGSTGALAPANASAINDLRPMRRDGRAQASTAASPSRPGIVAPGASLTGREPWNEGRHPPLWTPTAGQKYTPAGGRDSAEWLWAAIVIALFWLLAGACAYVPTQPPATTPTAPPSDEPPITLPTAPPTASPGPSIPPPDPDPSSSPDAQPTPGTCPCSPRFGVALEMSCGAQGPQPGKVCSIDSTQKFAQRPGDQVGAACDPDHPETCGGRECNDPRGPLFIASGPGGFTCDETRGRPCQRADNWALKVGPLVRGTYTVEARLRPGLVDGLGMPVSTCGPGGTRREYRVP